MGLVAWASAGASSPETGAPSLEVVASPASLSPERDSRATVTISAGAPIDELSVTTNVGRLEQLRRVAPDRWTAEYVPPDETFPQLAIVSAAVRAAGRSVHGWTVLPLSGEGDAAVLSKPFSEISVRIGDRVFGPVRANKAGRALVPVIVPPGVETGYYGSTPVALGLPPTLHLHLMVDRPQIAPAHTERIQVRAYAVTPQGAPREGARISLSSSRGTLEPLRPVAPGVFEAALSLDPGSAGRVELSGTLADEPALVAKAHLEVVPGAPASIALAAEPPRVVTGEANATRVSAQVRDAGGNPVPGKVRLRASFGALSSTAERGPGLHEARWELPARLYGRSELVIEAELDGVPGVRPRLSVPVDGGAAPVSPPPPAEPPQRAERWLRASPKLGLLTNLADVTSPYVGAEVALHPWKLPGAALLVEAGGFAFSNDSAPEPPLRISGRNQYVAAGASVAFEHPLFWSLSYRVAGGAGAALVSSELKVGEQPAVVQARWVPSAQLAAGLSWALWRGGPVAEARVAWYGDPALDNLRGALLSFNALVGYRFELL